MLADPAVLPPGSATAAAAAAIQQQQHSKDHSKEAPPPSRRGVSEAAQGERAVRRQQRGRFLAFVEEETSKHMEKRVRNLVNDELVRRCGAALLVSATHAMAIDTLWQHVDTANDLAETQDNLLAQAVEFVRSYVKNAILDKLSWSDEATRLQEQEALVHRDVSALIERQMRSMDIHRFFKSRELVVIEYEKELWRFEMSTKEPPEMMLEPGIPAECLDTPGKAQVVVTEEHITLEVTLDETQQGGEEKMVEKSAADTAAAEEEPKKKPKKSKKKMAKLRKRMLKFSERVLQKAIVVTEDYCKVARCVQQIQVEAAKHTEEGQFVGSPLLGVERPDELSTMTCTILGMEFRKLYQTFEPSQRVQQDRKRVQENMQFIVDRAYRGHVKIHVELFGSSINNLGFSTSDVDICLRIPQSHGLDEDEFARLTNMFRLANILRRFGMQDVRPVASARVPICKFVHPETGLQCDANFGNELGVKNSLLLRTYTLIDPRVRPLVMLVKNWAKNRDLNDAADGGTITSYAYSLMVLNFLQIRGIIPSLQELYEDPVRQTLEVLLPIPVPRMRRRRGGNDQKKKQQGNGLAAAEEKEKHKGAKPVDDGKKAGDDKENESDDEEEASDDDASEPETGDTTTLPPKRRFTVDVSFISTPTHPSLAPYHAHSKTLTPHDIWCGPSGIAALFHAFMTYYAWDYRFRHDQVVSVRTARVMRELTPELMGTCRKSMGMALVVEDPFQLDRNCTGSLKHPGVLVREMRRALMIMGRVAAGAAEEPIIKTPAVVKSTPMTPTELMESHPRLLNMQPLGVATAVRTLMEETAYVLQKKEDAAAAGLEYAHRASRNTVFRPVIADGGADGGGLRGGRGGYRGRGGFGGRGGGLAHGPPSGGYGNGNARQQQSPPMANAFPPLPDVKRAPGTGNASARMDTGRGRNTGSGGRGYHSAGGRGGGRSGATHTQPHTQQHTTRPGPASVAQPTGKAQQQQPKNNIPSRAASQSNIPTATTSTTKPTPSTSATAPKPTFPRKPMKHTSALGTPGVGKAKLTNNTNVNAAKAVGIGKAVGKRGEDKGVVVPR